MKVACVLVGGDDFKISASGTVYEFEMHPYMGPCPKQKLGNRHPFWFAVSQWSEQGRKVGEDGLCVWYHEAEEIFDPDLLAAGIYFVRGYKEPKRGE